MTFSEYYSTLSAEQKIALADAVGTSVAYLSQIAHGVRFPGGRLVLRIIEEAGGRIPAEVGSFDVS